MLLGTECCKGLLAGLNSDFPATVPAEGLTGGFRMLPREAPPGICALLRVVVIVFQSGRRHVNTTAGRRSGLRLPRDARQRFAVITRI